MKMKDWILCNNNILISRGNFFNLNLFKIFLSFLEQAAQAGRLEEVKILEKNLHDLEAELKKLELPTPR